MQIILGIFYVLHANVPIFNSSSQTFFVDATSAALQTTCFMFKTKKYTPKEKSDFKSKNNDLKKM